MSIYIKNLNKPVGDEMIVLMPDGAALSKGYPQPLETMEIIEVPPHGRLIDADVLLASFKESIDECHEWANEIPNETEMYARVSQALGTFVECSLRAKGMPTVIPADKDGEA